MRFTANTSTLLDAIKTAKQAIGKSHLPIMESLLFERQGDRLALTGGDLETFATATTEVQWGSPGDPVAIPADQLYQTLRALPDIPVSLQVDDDKLHITTDQGHYEMAIRDGDDYPDLPSVSDGHALDLSAEVYDRISDLGFAVSTDALRPAMMGVYLNAGPAELEAVATDGHRLARLKRYDVQSEAEVEAIIPAEALGMAKPKKAATVHVGESHIQIQTGDTTIISRVIDQQYPNYQAVLPDEAGQDKELRVGAGSFEAAVKRTALYASSISSQVKLNLNGRLQITAEDIERSAEAEEELLCEYQGEPMEIAFNGSYVSEVLKNVGSDDVIWRFDQPNRAATIHPADQPEHEDLLMLLMPVMLNNY